MLDFVSWQFLAHCVLQIFSIAHDKGQRRAKFVLHQPQNLVAYFLYAPLKICFLFSMPSYHRAYRVEKFALIEWFGQIIDHAGFFGAAALFSRILAGEKDNRE